MAEKDVTALRKRAQISKANRIMFIWVACASVVVSASAVLVIVMVQKGLHNQKAISELNKTVKVIKENNSSVEDLEGAIRALGSNESLLALRSNPTDNALQVILDALPAHPNPSALGASLQAKLFPADLIVESMEVTPVSLETAATEEPVAETEASDTTTEASTATAPAVTTGVIAFRFVVEGDAVQLKTVLERLEKSIRTIQIVKIVLESNGDKQSLTVEGEAYYQPSRTLQLTNLDVKP